MYNIDIEKLNSLIKKKGITKKALSGNLGIHRTTFNNWLSGKSKPSKEQILSISKILNINPESFSNLKITNSINKNNIISPKEVQKFKKIREQSKRDILEHVQSTDQLIDRLSYTLNCITSSFKDMIYVKSLDLKYVYVNDSFLMNTGIKTSDEILGKTDYQVFPKKFSERNNDEDIQVINSGIEVVDDERYFKFNRKSKFCKVFKYPIFDEEKNITGIIGIYEDQTEIIEKQKSFNLIKHNFDNMNIGFAIYNETDNEYIYVNDAKCKLLRLKKHQILGKSIEEIAQKVIIEDQIQEVLDRKNQKRFKIHYVNKLKSGRITYVTLSRSVFEGKKYISIVDRDITEAYKKKHCQ